MEYAEFEAIVRESFPALTDAQMEKFKMMQGLYEEWNAKINVVSRKDIVNLYDHHVLHSLAIVRYMMTLEADVCAALDGGATVLDLGTGGGFPGIPFAVMFPAAKVTLCDSVGKKVKVAAAVAASLGLGNVTAVNARAETLREKHDFVISRAVASLEDFYPWIRTRYSRGVYYLRGGDVAEETANFMGRYHRPRGSVHVWPVSSWLADPWFEGKFLVRMD